ncbi:MAG: dodecin domain-containing protein [Proteobacteria bacterium]|nr:dodecin domain-containing protein [Pseudomonadota bacterium]
MSIVKVIEILVESEKSWEEAARDALREASATVRNIKSLSVENLEVAMEDGKALFRLDAKISFLVEDHKDDARGAEQVAQAPRQDVPPAQPRPERNAGAQAQTQGRQAQTPQPVAEAFEDATAAPAGAAEVAPGPPSLTA